MYLFLFFGFRRYSKITATDCTGQKAQPTLVEIDKPRCGQLFSHSSLIGEFPLSGLGTSVKVCSDAESLLIMRLLVVSS